MNEVYETLEELFIKYQEDLKPYLISLEAKIEIFPEAILNEIRALFDHCSRIVLADLEDHEKIAEIHSAQRHIYRSAFDCFKELCLYFAQQLEDFERNYRKIPLGDVDSGKFLPKYTDRKNEAETVTREAKNIEKSGGIKYEVAISKYKEAVLAYEKAVEFIRDNRDSLQWTVSSQKRSSRKFFSKTIIISFIVGVATTLLGTWLYTYF